MTKPPSVPASQFLTQSIHAHGEVMRMRTRVIEQATQDGFGVVEIDDCIIITEKDKPNAKD